MMKIEKQNLNFDVYEGDRKILHVEYDKENDKTVVEILDRTLPFNFFDDLDTERNAWDDIEYFLLRRIVNCNPSDPIEYLKKTEGRLFTDPIYIKFN